ncbi:hypothetical protein DV735_g2385, partial [Chaetothyriales sp. CBS 134920]
MAGITGDRVADAEAQAAVTDFLDYTEYLPSDLLRSLTLIRGLDDTYLSSADAIDDLAKQYGAIPRLDPAMRPDPQRLRLEMLAHLNRGLSSRETAYAEACRLFDVADRHQNRLKSIIAKLNAIPKPSSRQASPVQTERSPQKVSRSGRKLQTGAAAGVGSSATRLTLNPPRGTSVAAALLGRPRGRRVTVPGEVMPPYDPDEAIASTEVSDWGSPPPSPPRPVLKLKQPKRPKEGADGGREKPVRVPREHVTYRKPTPPPEDTEIGSKYQPWTHLTEYEMYRLRKKMKKNHEWEPSQVMIRRELESRGRGWDNYYKAKAEAEKNGTPFPFVENSTLPKSEKAEVKSSQAGPAVPVAAPAPAPPPPPPPPAPARAPTPVVAASIIATNTTAATATTAPDPAKAKPAPKKTEAKKEKKVDPARDRAAAAAQEAELAARRLGDIGSAFKNLFSPLSNALATLNRSTSSPSVSSPTTASAAAVAAAAAVPPLGKKTTKKRKLEELVASAEPSAEPDVPKKKLKTPVAALARAKTPQHVSSPPPQPSAGTVKIPLKLKVTGPGPSPTHSASITPISATQAPSAAAPSTARSSVALKTEESTSPPPLPPPARKSEEVIDPDEERYCICGDVSYGEMICCEMDEKCEYGQWFHMECVGLVEMPGRTVKWYCPGDRKKFKKGENSNGLVGRGIK